LDAGGGNRGGGWTTATLDNGGGDTTARCRCGCRCRRRVRIKRAALDHHATGWFLRRDPRDTGTELSLLLHAAIGALRG